MWGQAMKRPDLALGEATSLEAQAPTRPDRPIRPRFGLFFRAEWPRLRAYLSRFVSGDEAEDLAQEAFARVFAVKGEIRSESGLLYDIARNLLIDRNRRKAVAGRVLVEDQDAETVADPQASPEERVDLRERLERATRMLDRMPPRSRECFLLQTLEGLTYAEIAARTGLSVVGVKKQLLRAFEICAQHGERKREGRRNWRAKKAPKP